MDLECVLCKQSTIDLLQLGEKHTLENVTAHYHCMVSATTADVVVCFRCKNGILLLFFFFV